MSWQYIKNSILTLTVILLLQGNIFAQNKSSLQKKYSTILKDIKGIENLIKKTETQKKQSLYQLQSLNAKISSRETLIENINQQIKVIDKSIDKNKGIIQSMQKDIEKLKKDYAQMVYHSYKNIGATSLLSFLLSSDSFNQAIHRLNYLRSYARFRKKQAKLIKETINGIEEKVVKLETTKAEKQRLLAEERNQRAVLIDEKEEKDTLVKKLNTDSSNLKKKAAQKNKAAKELNNQIQKIIKREIKATQAKAKQQAKENAAEAKATASKEIKLSKDFVSNKGKLPWPVSGHIVERFGTHRHPTIPSIKVNNNGIDIRTKANEAVKAIFEGVVVNSFYLPTTHNTLIIKHGEYFTVYSNLASINVAVGDKISTKQKIGVAYTDSNKRAEAHLEVWKSTTKLNPEDWIMKR